MSKDLETGKWIVKSLGGVLVLSLATGMGLAQSSSQTGSSDAQVQSAVTSALAADTQLRGQQVTASVQAGVVTLNGNVNDDSARLAAEQTAAQIAGVKSIEDNISVGQQQAQNQPQDQTGQQATGMQPNEGPVSQNDGPISQQSQPGQMPPPPPQESASQQPQYQQQPYSQPQGQYQQQPYSQSQGQYPQQQPYAQPQGQYQQPYGYQPPPPPRPLISVNPQRQDTSGPVTIPSGTLLTVRTNEPLIPGKIQTGQVFQVTATSDIYENGVVAIPRGSILSGQVVEAKKAGAFAGRPELILKLSTLNLGGQTYTLATDNWSTAGPGKGGYTAGNTVGGAAFGALIGAIAGGGVGAGIGAVAGGATGAAVSGATPGARVGLPPEAILQFHLTAPIEVQPVKYDEAVRLASTIPQQPVLRPRPAYYAVPRPYPYYYPRYYGPGYY